MDLRTKLSIIHSDGATETDYSREAQDFKRDTFAITLETTHFVYVGYKKPINALYISMPTPNTIASSLTWEYYSESGWAPLDVSDETNGLTRDAFITWNRFIVDPSVTTNPAEIAIAGETKYWVRFAPNDNLSAITFQAINLLFSDDNDMSQEVPALVDACFYPAGQTSHVVQHAASKNYIISRLRQLGYIKYTADGLEENIDQWDILDIYEIKQASTYHTISQIYFNLSDSLDDQYWVKYKEYGDKFESALKLGQLRIDNNDDGEVDSSEKRPIKTIRWGR